MYKRILVPIDGSATAERGLDEAIALAAVVKGTLRLLNLTNDFPLMAEMASAVDLEKYREGLSQVGRIVLDGAVKRAAARGVAADTVLRPLRGERVAEAIVEEAKASESDLIVIGSHGRRGFSRALLGSDAESVVRTSPVPVLVVRDPAAVVRLPS